MAVAINKKDATELTLSPEAVGFEWHPEKKDYLENPPATRTLSHAHPSENTRRSSGNLDK